MRRVALDATLLLLLLTLSLRAADALDMPRFEELLAAYPGYRRNGGAYSDAQVLRLTVGDDALKRCLPADGDTSALRLSAALNGIGGDHRIGRRPINLSKYSEADSCASPYGWHSIFRSTAYGPYLAIKYFSPDLLWPSAFESGAAVLQQLAGSRGIVRVVTWHNGEKAAGARLGLWDCDHFHQSRDWSTVHRILSMEFWKTPGANCTGR